jgi:hypothetical protein
MSENTPNVNVADSPTANSSSADPDFATQAEAPSRNFAVELMVEFLNFLVEEKKWWLVPIIVCLALIAIIALLLHSPAAPFIYPIF